MDDTAIKLYASIKNANEVREMDSWHASSIAECPRALIFKRLKIPALHQPGAGKMLRWKAGHIMEEVIRPHILNVYPDTVSNVRLENKELNLTGEYDNYSKEAKTIIEVKSVHDMAFKYRRKDDGRYNLRDSRPYLNHELQNHAYAILIESETGETPEFIEYVYITLDGRIATYKTAINQELTNEVKRRLDLLNKAWQTNLLPECVCKESHPLWKSTLQYCDYRADECCSSNLIKGVKE